MPVRLGAVGYLNARPLTWALDRDPERWHVRYDLPSVCSELLQRGEVDVGLVPSIEYLQASEYLMVPGVAIGSFGPVASVALYSRMSLDAVRTIALDTSSRTSVALVKVLCQHRFRITPVFVPHGPDLKAMTHTCDAALLIGDPALEVDHSRLGLRKTDLGSEWTAMTGLPFVYAGWTGRPGAVGAADVHALQKAGEEGSRSPEAIAAEYAHDDAVARARAESYLRDNVKYRFGPQEIAGLQLFLDYAADLGVAPRKRRVEFFDGEAGRP